MAAATATTTTTTTTTGGGSWHHTKLLQQRSFIKFDSAVFSFAERYALPRKHGSSSRTAAAAAAAASDSSKPAATTTAASTDVPEFYEVELDKPYGIKFYKGSDGGTYIDAIAPGSNADRTKMFQVGDKVIATRAVFGDEMWPAAEYGRTMYTVRQRIGPLLMKMQKKYGEREELGVSAAELSAQRNSNVIGDKLREIQIQNYKRKMQQKKQREIDLQDGLKLYRNGKYEDALAKFESVLGSKPDKFEEAIASYNIACCYSKLNQIEAGLTALEEALAAGFDDYKKARTDEDLANLRSSERFKQILDKYDEPFINENAIKALKGIFGFGK